MKKYLFVSLATVFFFTFSNVGAKNIEDFGWSFKKDSNYVYSSIDKNHEQTCELNVNKFSVEKEIKLSGKVILPSLSYLISNESAIIILKIDASFDMPSSSSIASTY